MKTENGGGVLADLRRFLSWYGQGKRVGKHMVWEEDAAKEAKLFALKHGRWLRWLGFKIDISEEAYDDDRHRRGEEWKGETGKELRHASWWSNYRD